MPPHPAGGLWRGVGLAFVAALAIGPGVTPPRPTGTGTAPTLPTEIAAAGGGLRILAVHDGGGMPRISRTSGAALPGRVPELRAIRGEDPPVSLGVLPAGATAAMALPDDLRPALSGPVLAVSDQPPGGSPTGQPTVAVLALDAATEIGPADRRP